ncbi:hypothetical protein D5S17_22445 [Pseudonocardiaceae bacterium YIM PH 21723]|nr:hypothetical protein D5S17_22445 [Pseudonocardiaceae bacterium YIM PH 21723]
MKKLIMLAAVLTAITVLGAPAQAAGKTIKVAWQHQTHGYNCGPAATRIAISAYTSSLPAQEAIGKYEGTSSSTGTDRWHVQKGLAHYAPKAQWRVVSNANQGGYLTAREADIFHHNIENDIKANHPLAINIVVHPGGARPPGWSNPGQIIDHWVVINGFDPGARSVLVTDPASTGRGFNKDASYWVPLSTMDKLVRKTYIW